MGNATTRSLERVAAAMGQLQSAPVEFEAAKDVCNGGVLLAVPALLSTGLLRHTGEHFKLPSGFYGLESLFLLLALTALARIASIESLRYVPPGEWGKLLGLDRIPEVRTLRNKLGVLCSGGNVQSWSTQLSSEWMKEDPQSEGIFYADGHVRVYHGKKTELPRRYVARQRLCLRGITDYWINALDGQPFFLVRKEVDPGILTVLREEIIPQLEKEYPSKEVSGNGLLEKQPARFTVVFDRAGYSPEFFLEMKEKGIAILTYHKFAGEAWKEAEFMGSEVKLANGEVSEMKMAERGTCLSNQLWVREIRKLSESGHQTSILSTDYSSGSEKLARSMFARWCQENFFKYMMEHFHIDRLIEYGSEPLPETTRVVHPRRRELESQIRRKAAILHRKTALFGAQSLDQPLDVETVETYQKEKGELQEQILHLRDEIQQLKDSRKALPTHITLGELPQADRFKHLPVEKKHLVDTIKLIAYRAETAMSHVLRDKLARKDDVRSLLRQLYTTEADLEPDLKEKTLTVRLHHLTHRLADEAVEHLCDELNATETLFPGTHLKMIYKIGSS